MRGRAAAPKGMKSCRIQGTFVHSSVRPSPQALSGLKSALSGLESALSGLKSVLTGLESEEADFRPGGQIQGLIVAKALDGQRYPLPLCECMWVRGG